METYIKITQFLLSLSLLIVLHELGHFIPAKLFKTRVEKFYLFFDYKFSIFKKKIGDTVYGIGWIPLGGYVKISGMIDESMDKEQMAQPPQPWEFRSKPAWQRLIIMLGGVTVNFILGIFIYIMMFNAWGNDFVAPQDVKEGFSVTDLFKDLGFKDGDKIVKVNNEIPVNVLDINKHLFLREVNNIEVSHVDGNSEIIELPEDIGLQMWQTGNMDPFNPRIHAILDSVIAESPAELVGLQKGDVVTAVNDQEVLFWNEFTEVVKNNPKGKEIKVTVDREGRTESFLIVPNDEQKLGVYPKGYTEDVIAITHKDYSFGESIVPGFSKAYWTLKDYMGQFKYVFTKKGATQLGGFITIGSIFPSKWNWQAFWSITALLSIMLGFMNLLPIPALDGGHVVFTLFEIISGRKPSDKFLEYAQITGFIILISLLLFANGNDIYKWLTGQF
ncbi:RIP metalloprotease RseP [Lutimonas halocynthiae]|uniref:RIP metalloprotease RseP n=1 Tax=Lutimonas halocynthiae TaxID=1446477 RepID=UPI0025B37382|nr:RIP metalloprotease RseP [Lutimonas halocynthiae]MDN3642636.1 RIP metalloprotease RseP [Lutimonas halocynthiae]